MLTRQTIDFIDNPHDNYIMLTRQEIIDGLRYLGAEATIFDKTGELAILLRKLAKEATK